MQQEQAKLEEIKGRGSRNIKSRPDDTIRERIGRTYFLSFQGERIEINIKCGCERVIIKR